MVGGFDAHLGQAAALATSMLWTATSLLFTAASKRIGPTIVNAARIFLAIGLLGLTHLLLTGAWLPQAVTGQVLFLALSGLIGLTIGDQALLIAFVDIGPRLAMLLMTTSPLFAALFGWVALGEALGAIALMGIALTIGGVAWVVLERPQGAIVPHGPHRTRGVLLGLVAAACQAGGLLLSKQGMGHGWLPEEQHLDPQAATFIRMVFAGVGVLPVLVWHAVRERKRRAIGLAHSRVGSPRAGLIFTALGTIAGPYLGVWMSLVACDRAPVGIAQTLCSLTPVFILPFAVLIHKERLGPRAVIGAAIAVGGSVLLFWQLQ